jgi:hypothetical protein
MRRDEPPGVALIKDEQAYENLSTVRFGKCGMLL